MRDRLIEGLSKIPHSCLNGDRSSRVPGTVNFCFEGIEGESLLLLLDAQGIEASSGSACTLIGGARLEVPLAKDGDYVKEWKYCDLSDAVTFQNITSLSFSFEGSKKNDYGLTTPTYICIDDIEVEYEK